MQSFDLIDEKWIPCIFVDGSRGTVGIRDALVSSHSIREINDSSPLVIVALMRLMLAILHRNFGPENLSRWVGLWRAGRWDDARLSTYFEKWRSRFDLFDKDRPFYQSKELASAGKHPTLHLAMETSSGNNATLFDHSGDEAPLAVSPAVAARYVIATQAYAIGFGKSTPFYFSDSPLIRGLTVSLLGDNLFQTLALNLMEYNENVPFEGSAEDAPIWEQDYPAEPNHAGTPIKGYLDYLTWQSRNIHLFPEGNPVVVRHCQIQQRLKLPKQQYLDPFKCFEKVKDKGFIARAIRPDIAVWRDSHTLFQTAGDDFRRPEIFNWLARINNRRLEGEIAARPSYSFTATGLATEAGKAGNVLLWRQERLPLPLIYLSDQMLLNKLKEALDIAENVGDELRMSIWNVARIVVAPQKESSERLGDAQKKDVNNLADSISPARSYWARLGVHFNRLVVDLASDRSADGEYGTGTVPWWAGEVSKAARLAFREATDSLDHSGRWLRAVTIAEDSFNQRLNSAIKGFKEP